MRYAFENSETLVKPGTVPKSLRSKAPKFTEAPASISLFPNPASEMLIVQYTVAESAQVTKKLDERSMPLDEYQRAMIDEGLLFLSSKEKLQSMISYHETKFRTGLNRLIAHLLETEKKGNALQEFLDLVDGYETLEHFYLFTDLYLERGDFAAAQTTLDALETDFNKSQRKEQEYLDHMTCYDILLRLATENSNSLTQGEIDALHVIAEKRNNIVAGKARAILIDHDGYEYHEAIHFPEFGEKSMKRGKKPVIHNSEMISVYPNPAKDHIIISCSDCAEGTYMLLVSDAKGQVVKEKFMNVKNDFVLDVSGLKAGSYTMVLQAKGQSPKSKVFEVTR